MNKNDIMNVVEEVLVRLEKVEVHGYGSMANQCLAIEKLVDLKNKLALEASAELAVELQNGSK